jgi:MFS family permease
VKPRFYAWLLVALLWVVALLNYVDRQVIFSLFPLLSSDLKLSSAQLGLLSTVFLWVYGILSPFAGYLADRFGRSRIILGSLLVWTLVTIATGHAQSFAALLCARALMGISEACYLPAALALIADHHDGKTRSLATGIHQSGLYSGMILGGVAGGWLGQKYGWRAAFTVLGIAGVVYFFVLLIGLRNSAIRVAASEPTGKGMANAVRELIALPGFATLAVVFSAISIANWMVYTWLPLYLYERFSMSLMTAGFYATFYIQIASFAGILAGGWLADRWGNTRERGRLLIQVGGVLLASPFLFLLGHTDSRLLLILALVAFGIGRGFYECNTMPVLCQIVRPALRSTAYGLFNFCGCVVGGAAAGLAGGLKDMVGLASVFQLAAGILCISGILLFRVRLHTAQSFVESFSHPQVS